MEKKLFNCVDIKHEQHPFHLVDPSPWPLMTAVSLWSVTLGFIMYFHYFNNGVYHLLFGLSIFSFCLFGWFSDVIREATYQGYHTFKVQQNVYLGVFLISIENKPHFSFLDTLLSFLEGILFNSIISVFILLCLLSIFIPLEIKFKLEDKLNNNLNFIFTIKNIVIITIFFLFFLFFFFFYHLYFLWIFLFFYSLSILTYCYCGFRYLKVYFFKDTFNIGLEAQKIYVKTAVLHDHLFESYCNNQGDIPAIFKIILPWLKAVSLLVGLPIVLAFFNFYNGVKLNKKKLILNLIFKLVTGVPIIFVKLFFSSLKLSIGCHFNIFYYIINTCHFFLTDLVIKFESCRILLCNNKVIFNGFMDQARFIRANGHFSRGWGGTRLDTNLAKKDFFFNKNMQNTHAGERMTIQNADYTFSTFTFLCETTKKSLHSRRTKFFESHHQNEIEGVNSFKANCNKKQFIVAIDDSTGILTPSNNYSINTLLDYKKVIFAHRVVVASPSTDIIVSYKEGEQRIIASPESVEENKYLQNLYETDRQAYYDTVLLVEQYKKGLSEQEAYKALVEPDEVIITTDFDDPHK